MDKISVIIPVYKVANYIYKCALSLFMQTYQNVEYIFVNDCSPDESIQILLSALKKFPLRQSQTVIINHTINRGSAAARNTGLNSATGKYVIFIDSDDFCETNMLEERYYAKQRSQADIIVSDYFVNYIDREYVKTQKCPDIGEKCISLLLQGKLHGSTCNKLINRNIIEDNNIRFVEKFNVWEDLLFSIKCFYYANRIYYLNKPFLHYVQYENSQTAKMSLIALEGLNKIVSLIEFFLIKHNIYECHQNDLMQIKNNVRFVWLQYCNNKDEIKKITNMYPDANMYIMRNSVYPFYYKLALISAIKKIYWLSLSIVYLIRKMRGWLR